MREKNPDKFCQMKKKTRKLDISQRKQSGKTYKTVQKKQIQYLIQKSLFSRFDKISKEFKLEGVLLNMRFFDRVIEKCSKCMIESKN